MESKIDLFTINNFPSYRSHAEEIVKELNVALKEAKGETNSGIHQRSYLKKDILNNPNVYLSDEILGEL
ncbi:MAG: hypothetical protein ACJAXW_001973 [Candidatus Azotimanducaceae bacterium]|jgi:hypothetical protein